MHLTLDKIPKHVLHEVLDKWKRILALGEWDPRYWQPCALCHYLAEHRRPMNCISMNCIYYCPLDTNDWCCRNAYSSRLHIYYHKQQHQAWLTSVERFVNMLTRHLEPPNLAILWRYFNDNQI